MLKAKREDANARRKCATEAMKLQAKLQSLVPDLEAHMSNSSWQSLPKSLQQQGVAMHKKLTGWQSQAAKTLSDTSVKALDIDFDEVNKEATAARKLIKSLGDFLTMCAKTGL